MEDIKSIANGVVHEIYSEFNLLKQTKYGMFSDSAIMNLRTQVNIYNFRFLYLCFCGISISFGILLNPFTIVLLLIQLLPIILYSVCSKMDISLPFTLPPNYPPFFVAICVGYISAAITAYLNNYFLAFFLPIVIAVVIIRVHSFLAITDAEPEYSCQCCDPHCSCEHHPTNTEQEQHPNSD